MSRKSGAQAGENKLESRFAALTSGLLARKGQAAPSNSPIVDAAEETEAFTLGNALIPRKNGPKEAKGKAPSLSPLTTASRAAPPVTEPPRPAPVPAAAAPKAVAKATPAPAPPEPTRTPPAPVLRQPAKPAAAPAPQPLTVINERSFEAGYPENPSAEEIAAIDAEADEVASYFESFGDDAPDLDNDRFFDDEGPAIAARDPLDDLDDDFDAVATPAADTPPAKRAELSGVRATVSAQLGARAFLRLSLGAAEMQMSADELIAEAIEEYLDARGIDSLGGEEFLKRLGSAGNKTPQD